MTVGKEESATLTNYLETQGYVADEALMDTQDWPEGWSCYKRGDYCICVNSNICALYGILEYSRSTTDVNFISWNKAYSLYPYATFVEKEAYMLTVSDEESVETCERWLDGEGIGIRTLTLEEGVRPADERSLVVGRRKVGDKGTWIVELDTEGVQDPGRSGAILESSTFGVRLYDPPI